MWCVGGSVCVCMACVSVLKGGVESGPCKGSSTAAGGTASAHCGPPAGREASLCPPRTPLHCAASCNSVHLCKQLVESGAAIFASTISDIETAADKCEEMEEGYIQCSQFLYGRGVGTGPWVPFLGHAGHGPCRCLGQEKPQVHLGEAQSVSWERRSPRPLGLSLKTCYILMVRIPCRVAQNKVFPFLPGVLWAEEGDREARMPWAHSSPERGLEGGVRMVSCPHPVGPVGEGRTPLL